MSIFYYKLWKRMTDTDTTRRDLIDKCHISTYTLSRMKNGESVPVEVLEKICDYLNCDYGDIISRFNDQKENDSDFKTNKELSKDKLRDTLREYMLRYNYKFPDISEKSFVALNTVKSFLSGNNISNASAMKLLSISDEFRDMFVANLNNEPLKENDYTIGKYEDYQEQECLKCPNCIKDIICDVVPSTKFDKNGVTIKYDSYYKSYFCKNGYPIALDEKYEPRPKGKCNATLNCEEGIDYNIKYKSKIPAKPQFIVHEEEYIALLQKVDKGYITRQDDIIEYFKKKYNVSNIKIVYDIPAYKKDIESIPYWRIVSTKGMLQNTIYYSKELQRKKLQEEGLKVEVTPYNPKSIMVVNYKDHLFKFV